MRGRKIKIGRENEVREIRGMKMRGRKEENKRTPALTQSPCAYLLVSVYPVPPRPPQAWRRRPRGRRSSLLHCLQWWRRRRRMWRTAC